MLAGGGGTATFVTYSGMPNVDRWSRCKSDAQLEFPSEVGIVVTVGRCGVLVQCMRNKRTVTCSDAVTAGK